MHINLQKIFKRADTHTHRRIDTGHREGFRVVYRIHVAMHQMAKFLCPFIFTLHFPVVDLHSRRNEILVWREKERREFEMLKTLPDDGAHAQTHNAYIQCKLNNSFLSQWASCHYSWFLPAKIFRPVLLAVVMVTKLGGMMLAQAVSLLILLAAVANLQHFNQIKCSEGKMNIIKNAVSRKKRSDSSHVYFFFVFLIFCSAQNAPAKMDTCAA